MKSVVRGAGFLLLFVLASVLGQQPIDNAVTPFGYAGNGSIFYQSSNSVQYPFFTFNNVQNPISVSISYETGVTNFPASICLNYYESTLPISGANLEGICPYGAYGAATNGTSFQGSFVPPANQIKAPTASKKTTEGPQPAKTSESAQLYVKPSQNGGGLIVTIPDNVDIVSFFVFISGNECTGDTYPVGANGACDTIPNMPLNSQWSTQITNGSYSYFSVNLNTFVNNFNVTINGTKKDFDLFVQSGYYPTRDWYLNAAVYDDDDDSDTTKFLILTPGTYTNTDEVFYFGIYNKNSDPQTVNITTVSQDCPAYTFGLGCNHKSQIDNSAKDGIQPLSATLNSGTTGPNNGSVISYEYDDDSFENDYAYFSLNNYPNYPTPYYVRVTVGSNDVKNYAPKFFAKKGGFPSAQSNHYNASTADAIANQFMIQITDADLQAQTDGLSVAETWYFAVALPSDFSIWVGINCADCETAGHGQCYCGSDLCSDATTNYTVNIYDALYSRPTNASDSAGACTCSDDDYDYSFNCSAKNNGNATLYMILIAVGGLIVLLVALGVPIYCYNANKKSSRYDRM